MKATDINKLNASQRLRTIRRLLEEGEGIVDRDLFFEARDVVGRLCTSQEKIADKICTEDDT